MLTASETPHWTCFSSWTLSFLSIDCIQLLDMALGRHRLTGCTYRIAAALLALTLSHPAFGQALTTPLPCPTLPAPRSSRPASRRGPGYLAGHRLRRRHPGRRRPQRHRQPHPLGKLDEPPPPPPPTAPSPSPVSPPASTASPWPPRASTYTLRRVHGALRRVRHPARHRPQGLHHHQRHRHRLAPANRHRPDPSAGAAAYPRRLPELLHQLHLGCAAHARQQKYRLAFKALYDPPQFSSSPAGGRRAVQRHLPRLRPRHPGLRKRYGAALADEIDARIIGSAILPSILHQDPRYFYQGSGSIPSRALHAAAFTFTARGDNGKTQPNYSHLLGSLASAGISNVYHPAGSRGVGDTFRPSASTSPATSSETSSASSSSAASNPSPPSQRQALTPNDRKIVILSGASRSFIARDGVEGPATPLALSTFQPLSGRCQAPLNALKQTMSRPTIKNKNPFSAQNRHVKPPMAYLSQNTPIGLSNELCSNPVQLK